MEKVLADGLHLTFRRITINDNLTIPYDFTFALDMNFVLHHISVMKNVTITLQGAWLIRIGSNFPGGIP